MCSGQDRDAHPHGARCDSVPPDRLHTPSAKRSDNSGARQVIVVLATATGLFCSQQLSCFVLNNCLPGSPNQEQIGIGAWQLVSLGPVCPTRSARTFLFQSRLWIFALG